MRGGKGWRQRTRYAFADKRTVMKGTENADAEGGHGCGDYEPACMSAAERVTRHIAPICIQNTRLLSFWGGVSLPVSCGRRRTDE